MRETPINKGIPAKYFNWNVKKYAGEGVDSRPNDRVQTLFSWKKKNKTEKSKTKKTENKKLEKSGKVCRKH